MRKLILVLGLAVASCGGNQAANNAAVSEDTGAEQVTAVNDTTAIDAATGEAANMAADVNYMFNEESANQATNEASAPAPKKSRKKAAPSLPPDQPAVTNNAAE